MSCNNTQSRNTNLKHFIRSIGQSKELCREQSCVIIGRAADHVLRNHDRLMRVFISAPMAERVSRVCRIDSVEPGEAERLIKKKDKQRAAFISFYTDRVWGEAKNYDICVNTGTLGIEGAVEVLEKAARMKFSL